MTKFQFLYETDSDTDDGYRVIEAPTREAARLEWVRQVTAEGQTVRLFAVRRVRDDTIQGMKSGA